MKGATINKLDINAMKDLTISRNKYSQLVWSDWLKRDFNNVVAQTQDVLEQCKIEEAFVEEVRLSSPWYINKINEVNHKGEVISQSLTNLPFTNNSIKKLNHTIDKTLKLHKDYINCILEITYRDTGTID